MPPISKMKAERITENKQMYNFYANQQGLLYPHSRTRKILLIMKITTLILITAILHVSASTLAQKVTLNEKNAPLIDVFNDITAQTNYDFAFTNETLKDAKLITISVKNEELADVLKKIFEGQNLEFSIDNKLVTVKTAETSLIDKLKSTIKAELAQVVVTGKVQDELGKAMTGVTVRIKGTSQATVTDLNGVYSITVADNNTVIQFTYIGYESQELAAKNIPAGSVITLKPQPQNLREIVINKGYYFEKKELSTGNVSVVTSKEIEQQPVSDAIQAIKNVPGLFIQQTSGNPGAYDQISIRGQNSIRNGNDPLYIVDGVPFGSTSLSSYAAIVPSALGQPSSAALGNMTSNYGGAGMSPFNSLNPADIESIEILKDADATAIYGARGANGVIIITTKKGQAGDTRVDVNFQTGVSTVARTMSLLNTQQYLQMRRIAFANDSIPVPSIQSNPSNGDYDINGLWDQSRNTNWQKVLMGNTDHFTNAQVDLSGGNANTQFRIGLGMNNQGTVFPGDFSDSRVSGNLNITHASSDQRFHAQLTANYSYDNNDLPRQDLTTIALQLAPDAPSLYNKDGTLNWEPYGGTATWNNPLAYTLETADIHTFLFRSDLTLDYHLWKGLVLKSTFGYNNQQLNQTDITPASAFAPPNNNLASNRQYGYGTGDAQNWNIEPQLSYSGKIAKGTLNVLLGTTFQQTSSSSLAIGSTGFSSDALIANPLSGSSKTINADNYSEYRYESLYARINYTWDDKYLLNITGRRDGSSRFGPGKQYGDFGAAGAGWIFSKERWVADNLPWMNFGKLRASYGVTGSDQIPNYQYLSTYSVNAKTYQGATSLYPTQLTNKNYAWEVDKKLEAGLDIGFLKDRIDVSASFYRTQTSNELLPYQLPYLTGFSSILLNLPAVVQNSGFELELHTVNITNKDFSWSSSFNISAPRNKLVAYPGLASSPFANTYIVGQPLNIIRTSHLIGVDPQTGVYTFQTNNASGDPQYPQDINSYVSLDPQFYGGLQNSIRYKDFQLDFTLHFVKHKAYNYLYYFYNNQPGAFNQNEPTVTLTAWQHPGDRTNVEKFTTGNGNDYTAYFRYFDLTSPTSDGIITDASYIRLQNVSLSYRIPDHWQHLLHLRNAQLYVQGQNLLTFTHYLGLDPESGSGSLPPLRTITGGIKASF